MLTTDKRTQFVNIVRQQLHTAFDLFNVANVNADDVVINTNIRGRCAGRASKRFGVYHIDFNAEAIVKYWDDMVKDTVPHEIAHIICFIKPFLGSHHDAGWKSVCRRLGGDDSRTHDMSLTPAKQRTRYQYRLQDNSIIEVGSVQHSRLQHGSRRYFAKKTGETIVASMWVDYNRPQVQPKVQQAASDFKPKTAPTSSKAQLVINIIAESEGRTTKQIIESIMLQANMTKAGASTYYYKYR